MDDRVSDHASVLVDWSARVNEGDAVVVSVSEATHELAVAVMDALGSRGANPVMLYASDEAQRAYLRSSDGAFTGPRDHERAIFEHADCYLGLGGGRNTMAQADVPSETRQAFSRVHEPIREARLQTDWVSTVHPTRSLAQQAGMSFEAYQDFVYRAILRDWESLATEMARLKSMFDEGSTIRLDGEHIAITMDITDRIAINSAASVAYDSHNLPSGEVFTAPATVTGEIVFDVPMTIHDQRVRDVAVTFEDGRVTDLTAAVGEAAIRDVLETDAGASRVGEFGVGMNRGIDRPTDNILFDEKMSGTVHVALGRAYDACLPPGATGNQSAVHVDLIARMTDGSRMLVDDTVVQRDGVFRWEPGFSGT